MEKYVINVVVCCVCQQRRERKYADCGTPYQIHRDRCLFCAHIDHCYCHVLKHPDMTFSEVWAALHAASSIEPEK